MFGASTIRTTKVLAMNLILFFLVGNNGLDWESLNCIPGKFLNDKTNLFQILRQLCFSSLQYSSCVLLVTKKTKFSHGSSFTLLQLRVKWFCTAYGRENREIFFTFSVR